MAPRFCRTQRESLQNLPSDIGRAVKQCPALATRRYGDRGLRPGANTWIGPPVQGTDLTCAVPLGKATACRGPKNNHTEPAHHVMVRLRQSDVKIRVLPENNR